MATCARCGGDSFAAGAMMSAVRTSFRPQDSKFLTLETGDVDLTTLDEPLRRAFMCYLFLATVQELIIQHLDASILDS